MPFITEYLYQRLSDSTIEKDKSIMIKSYPDVDFYDEKNFKEFERIIEAIVSVRRCKTLIDQANQKIPNATIKLNFDANEDLMKVFVEKLAKVEHISFSKAKLEQSVTDVSDTLESMIPTSSIDTTAIVTRLQKQQEKIQKDIDKLSSMLHNEKFVANAPKSVIDENRATLEEALQKLEKINNELKSFT